MDLETLVTTMHMKDCEADVLDLFRRMNIQSDAIIANQTDYNSLKVYEFGNCTVKVINTDTRGSSKNRNIAIGLSTSEYLVFADDDMRFYDGYVEAMEREMASCPFMDSIKFYVETSESSTRKIGWSRPKKRAIATRRSLASSGTHALLIRRSFIFSKGLVFNENFGPGTTDYCGEDTIFLQDIKKRGGRIYETPVYIAEVDQSVSSWFEGHNEKYFVTEGKVIGTIYPLLSRLIVIRSAWRQNRRHLGSYSFFRLLSFYLKGIREVRRNAK